jgi:hypothetical protein
MYGKVSTKRISLIDLLHGCQEGDWMKSVVRFTMSNSGQPDAALKVQVVFGASPKNSGSAHIQSICPGMDEGASLTLRYAHGKQRAGDLLEKVDARPPMGNATGSSSRGPGSGKTTRVVSRERPSLRDWMLLRDRMSDESRIHTIFFPPRRCAHQ